MSTLYPSSDLFPGSIYDDATLQGTNLHGTKYDSTTSWPDNANLEDAISLEEQRRFEKRVQAFGLPH